MVVKGENRFESYEAFCGEYVCVSALMYVNANRVCIDFCTNTRMWEFNEAVKNDLNGKMTHTFRTWGKAHDFLREVGNGAFILTCAYTINRETWERHFIVGEEIEE